MIEWAPVGVCCRFLNWCGSPLPAPTVGFIRKWGGGLSQEPPILKRSQKSYQQQQQQRRQRHQQQRQQQQQQQQQLRAGPIRISAKQSGAKVSPEAISTWGQIISLVAMVSTICCQSSNSCHWRRSLKLIIFLRFTESDHFILQLKKQQL